MTKPNTKLRNSERLSQEIMNRIIEGDLKPGDRLPTEHELVQQYESSRITVREALSILAGMGLIDQQQGARRRILQLDASIFSRLFPLMVAMEGNRTLHDVLQVRRAL
ncbi:MAG: FadR/GntR family transcriptional regulator, partial [Candidatus Sumerlaeota bacterium]